MIPEIRIGVVEDADGLRRRLTHLLEAHARWRVVAACRTIAEARQRLPPARPQLVLLDLKLPDGSGVDLIPWLRTVLPGVTVVLLTVVDDPPEIVRAIQHGASGYLLKHDAGDLAERIGEILEGGAPVMSPSVARQLWAWAGQGPVPAGAPEGFELTPREQGILRRMARGGSEVTIAKELGIALNTIKVHRRHIYEKLGVHSRVEAVLKVRGGAEGPVGG